MKSVSVAVALLAAVGSASASSSEGLLPSREFVSVSSLLEATRLSNRPMQDVFVESALRVREEEAKEETINLDGKVDYDALLDENTHKGSKSNKNKNSKKKKQRNANKQQQRSMTPLVSPTGGDNLLLDFIRFSAYEHTVRSDGVMVSNTSGPFISVTGEARAAVEVPHLVQVWAVRPAQEVEEEELEEEADTSEKGEGWVTHSGARKKKEPQWHLSPDALTTHYFAVEHTATAADREAVTGVLSHDSLSTKGGAEGKGQGKKGDAVAAVPADAAAKPFAIKGTLHPAPPRSELSVDNPAWMNAVNRVREGPVGTAVGSLSSYIQTRMLEAEEAVKSYWYGNGHSAVTSEKIGGLNTQAGASRRSALSAINMKSVSLNIEGARLVGLAPTTPVDGSFHVEVAMRPTVANNGHGSSEGSALLLSSLMVSLEGNYSFVPSRGFMPNPKIDGPAAFSAHTFFDYSLTFVSSGAVSQQHQHVDMFSSSSSSERGKDGAAAAAIIPRCTHYRAVAQYDKRHIALTTFWEVQPPQDDDGSSALSQKAITFERSVTLSLQEVAGVDIRFAKDQSADEVDEEDRQRFRFMDSTLEGEGKGEKNAAISEIATMRSVASAIVKGISLSEASAASSASAEEKALFIQPSLRRVELPSYYRGEDGKTYFERVESEGGSASVGSTIKRYIPISGRLKKLIPTIALLIVVTLVKFGPKFYLAWLDAKQQKRKGAVSMKTAIEATLQNDLIRNKANASTSLSPSAQAAKAKALKDAEEKGYGSGKQLAKAEAILKAHMVKNPQWRKGYEEALDRRKQMSPKELEDLKAQELALLEQMKREDGLL